MILRGGTLETNQSNLIRLVNVLAPKELTSSGEQYNLVPGEEFAYPIHQSLNAPRFVLLPREDEIIFRLILRAIYTEDESELSIN